jgi:hypothetical protein
MSSCEFGIEPLGSINCWETIKCPKQLGICRIVLSSMELVMLVYDIKGFPSTQQFYSLNISEKQNDSTFKVEETPNN